MFFFFQIFKLGNTFENIYQKKSNKIDFCKKNHFFGIFWHFLVNIFKNIFENFDQKRLFFAQNHFSDIFGTFWSIKFQNNIA